jgi:hypothetical protein
VTTYLPSLCRACTRLDQGGDTARCEAFPDGIPFDIIGLGGDHRTPVEGDHGLQFSPADTEAARAMLEQWNLFHTQPNS